MVNSASYFETRGVVSALIIDDAYDAIPLAADLESEEEWTIFFDDLSPEHASKITAGYPNFEVSDPTELIKDDSFVKYLWTNRDELQSDAIDAIFNSYTSTREYDVRALNCIESELIDLGIDCTKAGRAGCEGSEAARLADVVIIDLFLGKSQTAADANLSIELLNKILDSRRDEPPIVILMSRSPRLHSKKEEFRDQARLFESSFRILAKCDLESPGKLKRTLTRLASHYEDSKKLTRFLNSWEKGMRDAASKCASILRTLDLSDYSQIERLLLFDEGAPLGSYLVDVFDRVLQYEIECDRTTISAAIELNNLDLENYPPPYVEGSRNLQNLVFRCLFQGNERLNLPGSKSSNFAFGEILRRKNSSPLNLHNRYSDLSSAKHEEVYAVINPACDLQRMETKTILLLKGDLTKLNSKEWTRTSSARTSILYDENKIPYWVKWDLKHIQTISAEALNHAVSDDGVLLRLARMRESHALEIQQKLLSNLGRVGVIAPLPGTFPVQLHISFPNTESKLQRLELTTIHESNGTSVVGRRYNKNCYLLVLSESSCEEIYDAISNLDINLVHENCREKFERIRKQDSLRFALEKGIELPDLNIQNLRMISLTSDNEHHIYLTTDEAAANKVLTPKQVNTAPLTILIQRIAE